MDREKVISDTTMMFMACACFVLSERNKFGKKRLIQFMADIEQINRENEYADIIAVLNDKYKLGFPNVEE